MSTFSFGQSVVVHRLGLNGRARALRGIIAGRPVGAPCGWWLVALGTGRTIRAYHGNIRPEAR